MSTVKPNTNNNIEKNGRSVKTKIVSFLTTKMIVIGLLLSLWAIFSIEIEFVPQIYVPLNDATIAGLNNVFVALAYSYVAGIVLYWFTVQLPYLKNKQRLASVIEKKISIIGSQLLNMSLEFRNLENPQVSEVNVIMDLITTKRWTEACKIPCHTKCSNVTEAFFNDYYKVRHSVQSLINCYKDYLSVEQLILLESLIADDMNIISEIGDSFEQRYVFSNFVYENVIKPFYKNLLETYNKLAKSI